MAKRQHYCGTILLSVIDTCVIALVFGRIVPEQAAMDYSSIRVWGILWFRPWTTLQAQLESNMVPFGANWQQLSWSLPSEGVSKLISPLSEVGRKLHPPKKIYICAPALKKNEYKWLNVSKNNCNAYNTRVDVNIMYILKSWTSHISLVHLLRWSLLHQVLSYLTIITNVFHEQTTTLLLTVLVFETPIIHF